MKLLPAQILAYNAGAVESRVNRQTGTVVTVYNTEKANIAPDDGPYATVCEDHGCILTHSSRRRATSCMACPADWCEDCRKLLDEK